MNSFDGVFLSLVAAAMLGLNTAVIRRAVLKASAYNGVMISIPLSIPIFISFDGYGPTKQTFRVF